MALRTVDRTAVYRGICDLQLALHNTNDETLLDDEAWLLVRQTAKSLRALLPEAAYLPTDATSQEQELADALDDFISVNKLMVLPSSHPYIRDVLRHRDMFLHKAPAGSNKASAKRSGGRVKDPVVQSRNRKIVTDFQKGLGVDAVVEKYGITASLARKIKSDSEKTAKNRQS